MTDPKSDRYERLYNNLYLSTLSTNEEQFRAGYLRGYFAAVDDLEHLIGGGITRINEAYNVMADHAARPIVQWRYEDRGVAQSESRKPPKLEVPNWPHLRQRVFQRDGRFCVLCKSRHQLEIDHIKSVAEGGLPTLENLRVLCRTCNRSRPRGRWIAR